MRAVHLRAVATIFIMRTTLHERASNTYYGQWRPGKAAVTCIGSRAIAHNRPAANAGFAALDIQERDFLGNRAHPRGEFYSWIESKSVSAWAPFKSAPRAPG